MGKNSRRRKRKRNRNQALARREAAPGSLLRVRLELEQLELARGHDGLLRGAPEPALIVAVYGTTTEHAHLAGRYLYRFERPGSFPCKVTPRERSQESCLVVVASGAKVVLLALAVEEDSGRGLQSLYAALEPGDDVVLWTPGSVTPAPLHLYEPAPPELGPDLGHRVHLLLDGHDPSEQLPGDDWIDASVLYTSATTQTRRHRLHFRAADGRNDWTAELALTLRRA